MRIIFLSCLALLAFAANSILNRAAVADGAIGPASFAAIRVFSGALVLGIAYFVHHKKFISLPNNYLGPFGLLIYVLFFSFAYQQLNAGFGALVLFGAVQIAMFFGAYVMGRKPNIGEVTGACIAFMGLVYLMYPTLQLGGAIASVLMVISGIGWAIFSIMGQKSSDPLASSASSFILILPFVLGVWLFNTNEPISIQGAVLAMISGGVTSGMGYLVWYSVLPKIATTTAAVIQLSVPVIAIIFGIILLGEQTDKRTWVSTAVVVIGVLLSVRARTQRQN